VLFHAPGYYKDGQAGEVYPRVSKYSSEQSHGGFNVYELTDNQRAVFLSGEKQFGVESQPAQEKQEALDFFNAKFPNWQGAASAPDIVQASQWVLEILSW